MAAKFSTAAAQTRRSTPSMSTWWTAPGEGCYVSTLLMAATCALTQAASLDQFDSATKRALREAIVEAVMQAASYENKVLLRRTDLQLHDAHGAADRTDAGRLATALRRAL